MASQETTVSGLDELFKEMDALPDRVQKQIMRPALNAGAQVFEGMMQSTVPHGATGQLAKSIDHKISVKTSAGGVSVAGPKYVGGYKHTSNDPGVRSRFIEFGTRKMAPNPFVRRAFDMGKELAFTAVIDVLKKLMSALKG